MSSEPTTTVDGDDSPASSSVGSSKRPPAPSRNAVGVPPLSPIIEAPPTTRLSHQSIVEEAGEDGEDEGHESSEATPVLPTGSTSSTDASSSPMQQPSPVPSTSFDPTASMAGGLGIAPTPYPVAPFLRPSLHHTASASSVRGFSGSLHQAGPASVTFSSPPLQSASFYAATTRKASIGGPTGAGMAPEFGTTQRSRSSSQATRQATFVSRLSQADEDGDPSDWKRCWLYCKSMPGRAFLRVGPLSRRMYQEALAPWQRRFSDVEERQNQQRWWGLQGQGQGHQGRDRPLSPSGSVAVSAGDARGQQGDGAFCAQRLRGMSVDDLRSGYVLGKLPSLALTCAGLLDADVDADAAAADAAEAGGASPAESAAAKVGLIRKEDVLMKMCVTLHSYGCPVPRNEYSMQQLLRALGVEGSFTVLPSMIFASLGAPMSSASETHILRVGGGLDCYKLRRVNHLVNQILEHKVESLPQAIAKLDSIIEEPALYSWQVKLACYAISSGTVAPLFFKGSLLDGLVSGLIGVMAGALWVLSDSSYILGKVGLILTAFLTSFFATILTSHIKGLCPLACHFGAITYLLPGWSITVSVIELSTQNVLSGTSRLMGSLMSSVLLGFGLDLGHRMALWERPEDWVSTAQCQSVGPLTKVPLFLVTVTCFSILLKAAPAQWPGMLALSAMSFTTINVAFDKGMDPASATVLTAFLIGIAGNLYSYATNSPALVPMLIGIFLIVPGGMSVKGVHAIANNDMTGGVVWSNVMTVAVSIAVGLFAASTLMYKPKLKVSNTVFF